MPNERNPGSRSDRVGAHMVRIERRSTPAVAAQPPEPENVAERRSVLVVDADPRSRARLEELLSSEGYRTLSTGDVTSATPLIREEHADLVIVDVDVGVMEAVPRWERRKSDPAPAAGPPPVVDSYAVLRPLHLDARAARFPAVFLRQGQPQGERFGVVGYLSKPVQREALRSRMEGVFLALDESDEPGTADAPDLEPIEAAPAPGFEALPRGLRTALVVDPDETTRRLVRRVLGPHGFTIHEVTDGESALKVALAQRPWVIISEVNLPGMDGFELCRRIRAHSMTRRTPLIFLSSWDDYGERFLGLKLGGDDYLAKTTSTRELLIRIQLVLKRFLDVGTRTRRGSGLEGRVELIGVPGILQMCHLGRFSGACTVRVEARMAQIRFSDGEIVEAECGRARAAEAVFELLAWTSGHFEFVPDAPSGEPPLPESFDYLLLEGCRRLDEGRRPESAPD